uniref:Uncharacterized protein n=1 Tax=Plectus sambesii TaxID=2011161 RepID=A0A914XR32_9BILA
MTQSIRRSEIYFEDGLRTTKLYREDIEQLSDRLTGLKSKQDEERTRLFGLKEQLESSPSFSHNDPRRRFSSSFKTENGLSLAAVENPVYGCSEDTAIGQSGPSSPFSGFLWKKSAKKLHQQWQKRKCRVQEGNFFLNHSDEAQAPVKLSLLVCDVKPSCEDFRTFDLYCRDRTYHFQAESEADAKRWICALKREIEAAKEQMLRSDVVTEAQRSHSPLLSSDWPDRRRCVAAVRRLPGNDRCADCSSTNDVSWLSTNMGALVCISCSGVHRDLGVHISRMQSLDLDVLSPAEFLIPLSIGNGALNEVYEADARAAKLKPVSASTRSVRKQYIVDKYKTRKYAVELDDANAVLRDAID